MPSRAQLGAHDETAFERLGRPDLGEQRLAVLDQDLERQLRVPERARAAEEDARGGVDADLPVEADEWVERRRAGEVDDEPSRARRPPGTMRTVRRAFARSAKAYPGSDPASERSIVWAKGKLVIGTGSPSLPLCSASSRVIASPSLVVGTPTVSCHANDSLIGVW